MWWCLFHYGDVTWVSWRHKSHTTRLFVQQVVQAYSKETTKAPRHWPFVRGIRRGRWCGERFHVVKTILYHSASSDRHYYLNLWCQMPVALVCYLFILYSRYSQVVDNWVWFISALITPENDRVLNVNSYGWYPSFNFAATEITSLTDMGYVWLVIGCDPFSLNSLRPSDTNMGQ